MWRLTEHDKPLLKLTPLLPWEALEPLLMRMHLWRKAMMKTKSLESGESERKKNVFKS
jgi:hypothetical protein